MNKTFLPGSGKPGDDDITTIVTEPLLWVGHCPRQWGHSNEQGGRSQNKEGIKIRNLCICFYSDSKKWRETFLKEISLLTWGCMKAFAPISAWWTSSFSTPWDLVRNADSWAQLRLKDSEILRMAPIKPSSWFCCKLKCGRRERVPGIRYSRVNNSGWWMSSCWKNCLITCQRLGEEKEAQSHPSNNKKHRLASPGGIPARRMLRV